MSVGGCGGVWSAGTNVYVLDAVRPPLASAQGASIPYPYGGAPRVINVDLDLARLYAKGLSPSDVSAAVNAENVILPAGAGQAGAPGYNRRFAPSPGSRWPPRGIPLKNATRGVAYR